jgi:hypothetical protein
MAVLGTGGVLDISRAIPEPTALSSARISTSGATTTISLSNPGFWTGDRIIIASSLGVPFDVNNDGYADCPDGHGIYRGSIWDTGISRSFYVGANTDSSPFYRQYTTTVNLITQAGDQLISQAGDTLIGLSGEEDSEDFYNNPTNTGLSIQADGYISRDELDRIRLWTTETAAHAAEGTEKVISKVKTGNFIVAYYDDLAAYTSSINTAAATLNTLTLLRSEQNLAAVITLPEGFDSVCEDLNRNWKFQCDLEEWVMSIDAANLDTTAIGETFGEHVKSLVRGAGTLQFQADHRSVDTEEDGLALLRLVLLTQGQCNTRAKFHLYKARNGSGSLIGGSVYYECDILLTNSRLNTRATEVIAGTADFVATSEIKIQVSPS